MAPADGELKVGNTPHPVGNYRASNAMIIQPRKEQHMHFGSKTQSNTSPDTMMLFAESIQRQLDWLPKRIFFSEPLDEAARALGLFMCGRCAIFGIDNWLAPGVDHGSLRVAATDIYHGCGGSTTCMTIALCPDCAEATETEAECGHRSCAYGCDCPDECGCGCGDSGCGKDCWLCDGTGEHDIVSYDTQIALCELMV